MSDREIKVTDKRIFTPDGELREEYRFLDEKSTTAPDAEPAPGQAAPEAPPPPIPALPPPARSERPEGPGARRASEPWQEPRGGAGPRGPAGPALEIPGSPPELGAPTFYDLAAILAEPVALYLGDLELEDGQPAENLEMARMHLDLLDVLRQKTAGNLTPQESAFLEDLLYRLRVRYVQKRG
ncbi:MAG: hypothetical protein QOJ16_2595 [Acidobacteriota bacterium]|nr:hypothetical protein [Acidobacteriota bacterium]